MPIQEFTLISVNDRILFPNQGTNSTDFINNTFGLQRDPENYITSIPLDKFHVAKEITSDTFIESPVINVTTINYLGDLDGSNVPKIQTKAFTDALYNSLNSTIIQNLVTAGNANKITINSSTGALSINGGFSSNSTGQFNGDLTVNGADLYARSAILTGSSTCANTFILNGGSASLRKFNGCYYEITDTVGLSSTYASRISHSSSTLLIENNVNSSIINFNVKTSGGSSITPLSISSTALSTGTYTITQTSGVDPSIDTTRNFFRRTIFSSTATTPSSGTSGVTVEINDNQTGYNSGFSFTPNCSSTGFNSFSATNDSVIVGKTTATSAYNALTLTLYNPTYNPKMGIRLSQTPSTLSQIELNVNDNKIIINNSGTPISMNNLLTMVGSTNTSRRINDISVLKLKDIQGTSSNFEIYNDSNATVTNFVSYQNSYYIAFNTKDSSNVQANRFTINATDVSVASGTPFWIKSSDPTIKGTMNTSGGGVFSIISENGGTVNSTIDIKLRNASNNLVNVVNYNSFYQTETKYLTTDTTLGVAPSLTSHTGYCTGFIEPAPNATVDSGVFTNFATISLSVGTHLIDWSFDIINNSGGADILISVYTFGTSSSNSSFTLSNSHKLGIRRMHKTTVNTSSYITISGSTTVRRNTGDSANIYLNGLMYYPNTYLLTVGMQYQVTKLY